MDTKQIIDTHLGRLETEKEELRRRFLDELNTLGNKAHTAAKHELGSLPTLAWVETSMARLREIREAFEKADAAKDMLRRVADAAEFEASQKASAATSVEAAR